MQGKIKYKICFLLNSGDNIDPYESQQCSPCHATKIFLNSNVTSYKKRKDHSKKRREQVKLIVIRQIIFNFGGF